MVLCGGGPRTYRIVPCLPYYESLCFSIVKLRPNRYHVVVDKLGPVREFVKITDVNYPDLTRTIH